MNGLAVERAFRNDSHARGRLPKACNLPEASNLYNSIIQTERDQKADEARIDDAIMNAENEITSLEQRQLASEELHDRITAVRDKAVLIIRDVRKNMQRRTLAAERIQKRLSDALRQHSRFARDDSADESLRAHFFQLMERTPTFALVEHLRDALEVGNTACAELIRFEFRCRDDRHEFMTPFEATLADVASNDPVEMRKRLANIWKAAVKVDVRVTALLKRVEPVRHNQEGATAAA
jgi:hypothetical protein